MPGGARYEPKWDGFRMVIDRRDDAVRLWSRQGKDLAATFPDLAAAAAEQVPDEFLVDGEAVVWTDDRLDFNALQHRLASRGAALGAVVRERPASFAAFDILTVARTDAMRLPWKDRRALLEELARDWVPPLNLSPVTDNADQARAWFDDLTAVGIEGLVVKGASQRYEGGQRQWVKVKHRDTIDVICAAVIGPRTRPEAVVVGLPIDGELRIAGRSSPLAPTAARDLGRMVTAPPGPHPWPEHVKPGALDRFNSSSRDQIDLTLIKPVVVEVSADVAWSGHSFRHAVRFLRVRPELDPAEVTLPAFLDRLAQ
ncbi:ATP-dependent DNA ligase [Curtobacterium sp. MCPF17_003]|uniref:ATP-dependent DNA ligase n=1 Tax=Curtobacterium sp. MCPF17_003 TaxID=2175637 RepID=UPI000D8F2485|nr:ATP-dependent DNA ligase [Curtobacterium sp. MCPF17_003]PYY64537.1 ATP-dependent DNA ligase [Curtobacterium sp. MCPF17_003]